MLKDDFSSRMDLFNFKSTSLELFKQSMEQRDIFQYWNQQATSYSSPHCLVRQIQFQIATLDVATDQKPHHTRE